MTKNQSSPIKQREQGVVIIVALFFVGLVAAISWYMMGRLERDTHRTSLLLRNVNAEMYAQGSLLWAMTQLDANSERRKPDQIVDKMPFASPVDKINGYRISTVIHDAQGRFNLNNLTEISAQVDFNKLLQLLVPALTSQKSEEITKATVDWISPGQQQSQWDKYYLHLPHPYRAAHQLMVSRAEWQQVKGVTPAVYQALEKYVVALPITTPVNVLTASGPVLAALSPTASLETGVSIQKMCKKVQPVTAVAFLATNLLKNHPIKQDKITLVSNFFLVETTVKIEDQELVLYTLMERQGDKGKKSVITILKQSKSVPG